MQSGEIMHEQIGMDEILCQLNGTHTFDPGEEVKMTWRREKVTCRECLDLQES